ncbi:MAG: hypothetical protein GC154_18520 [bacterium]|nr:hypothetical protein [bacterium]
MIDLISTKRPPRRAHSWIVVFALTLTALAPVAYGDEPRLGALLSHDLTVMPSNQPDEIRLRWRFSKPDNEAVRILLFAPGPVESATTETVSFVWTQSKDGKTLGGGEKEYREAFPSRSRPRGELREIGVWRHCRIAVLRLYFSPVADGVWFPDGEVVIRFSQLDSQPFAGLPNDLDQIARSLFVNFPPARQTASTPEAAPAPYTTTLALKVTTEEEGFCTLGAHDVINQLGPINVESLSAYQDGAPAPVQIFSDAGAPVDNGPLKPGGVVRFFAPASTSSYATETVTWLANNAAGHKTFTPLEPSSDSPRADSLTRRMRIEHDLEFAAGRDSGDEQNRYWMWSDLLSEPTPAVEFNAPSLSGVVEMRVHLLMQSGAPNAFIDSATLTLNGVTPECTPHVEGDFVTLTARLNADLIKPSANRLGFTLDDPASLKRRYDAAYLDWIELAWASPVAPSASPYETPGHPVSLKPMEGVGTYWRSRNSADDWRFAPVDAGVTLPPTGEVFFLPAGARSVNATVKAVDFSVGMHRSLLRRDAADVLIIAPAAWIGGFSPFAAQLKRQGYTTRAEAVEAIYDLFGDGRLSPHAIKRYINWAYHEWNGAPSYVLLAGDATWDYHDRYGVGVKNFVPGYRLAPEYSVDGWYVRLDGKDDLLPDMSIARWPVRSAEELATLIHKTIEYKERPPLGPWLNQVFMVTDDGFERYTDELASRWMPEGFRLTRRHIRDYPLVDNIYLPARLRAETRAKTSLAATEDIIHKLNQGVWLWEFYGHGAPNVVGDERMFFGGGSKYTDVKKLANDGKPFLFWSFSCETCKFDYPREKWNISIGEDLLSRPEGGAVGLLGATGRGYPHDHIVLARGLHEAAFSLKLETQGQILMAAELFGLAAQSRLESNDQFTFLGDPTIRFPKFTTLEHGDLDENFSTVWTASEPPASIARAAAWASDARGVIDYATLTPGARLDAPAFRLTPDYEPPLRIGAEQIGMSGGRAAVAHGAVEVTPFIAGPLIEPTTGRLPNLRVKPDSLTITPHEPRSGETVFLDAVIENTGQASAMNVTVQGEQAELGKNKSPMTVVVGDRSAVIKRIDPGQSKRVRLRWDPTGDHGSYELAAEIDPYNQIGESDEDDNLAEIQITVLRKADLIVAEDEFNLTPIENGKRFQVGFAIKNIGESPASKIVVEMAFYRRGSGERVSIRVPEAIELSAGGRYAAGGIKIPADISAFEILIDPDEIVDEESHENNLFRYEVNNVFNSK